MSGMVWEPDRKKKNIEASLVIAKYRTAQAAKMLACDLIAGGGEEDMGNLGTHIVTDEEGNRIVSIFEAPKRKRFLKKASRVLNECMK